MKKVLSVVGTRPNFIKLAAIHAVLKKSFNHVVVHTGQHYDYELSKNFFDEFSLPKPNHNLSVGSAEKKEQIRIIRTRCQEVIKKEKPDIVLVYGDTNSTVGGAQSAFNLNVPVAHIEAGVRSFDKFSPEESNRKIVDNISNILFSPTKVSVENLKEEGIVKNVFFTGDVMYDIFLKTTPENSVLKENKIYGEYFFATIHRQENTNDKIKLKMLMNALIALNTQIVTPLHPRTEKALKNLNLKMKNIKFIKPVKYSQSIALQKNARTIITDSGGIQKEAYWLKVPCITLRDFTEWSETVSSGWNKLVGANKKLIQEAVKNFNNPQNHPDFYGEGNASNKIAEILKDYL